MHKIPDISHGVLIFNYIWRICEQERLENDLKTLEKGIEDCNNQIDSCVMAIAVKEVDIKTQKDLLESMQVNKQQLDYDVEHSKSALEIIEVKKIKAEKEVEERAHRIKELEYIIRITPAAIFAAIKGDFVKPCIENAVAPVSTVGVTAVEMQYLICVVCIRMSIFNFIYNMHPGTT